MGKIVFVKTDPTFMVAEGLVRELQTNGLLEIVGIKTIQSANFTDGNDTDVFAKWYDFERTAAVTLRLYMLKATGMQHLIKPSKSDASNSRSFSRMEEQPPPFGQDLKMAGNDEQEAKRFVAEFDRLYPHYAIETKMTGIHPGETRSVPTTMYVIDFPNSLLYQIVANMIVTFVERQPAGIIVHARLHVVAYKVCMIPPLAPVAQRDDFPRYFLLQDLIREHNEVTGAWDEADFLESGLARPRLPDEDDEDEVDEDEDDEDEDDEDEDN